MPLAWAPGRVNLIGDHTDYTGGLVLPMAIDLGTTVEWSDSPAGTTFRSSAEHGTIDLSDPRTASGWGRYVHAVAAVLTESNHRLRHIDATISSTLPIGAGLSSSASLEVAVAASLGAPMSTHDERVQLARLCQRAEQRAVGVPCGIMDQLIVLTGESGAAQLIDCHTLDEQRVPITDEVQVVVQFIAHRTLTGSGYGERVDECSRAQDVIGPLRVATRDDAELLADPVLRRRARHVVTENQRVRDFAVSMHRGDYTEAGRLMVESHHSLDIDYAVSIPAMNEAVQRLVDTPGVFGARMTGGGFGGCVVALADRSTDVDGWKVAATRGAFVSFD